MFRAGSVLLVKALTQFCSKSIFLLNVWGCSEKNSSWSGCLKNKMEFDKLFGYRRCFERYFSRVQSEPPEHDQQPPARLQARLMSNLQHFWWKTEANALQNAKGPSAYLRIHVAFTSECIISFSRLPERPNRQLPARISRIHAPGGLPEPPLLKTTLESNLWAVMAQIGLGCVKSAAQMLLAENSSSGCSPTALRYEGSGRTPTGGGRRRANQRFLIPAVIAALHGWLLMWGDRRAFRAFARKDDISINSNAVCVFASIKIRETKVDNALATTDT